MSEPRSNPAVIQAGGGHRCEMYRDIPRSCTCGWLWHIRRRRYKRTHPDPMCPWHTEVRSEH